MRPVTWCVVREVASGDWGIAGNAAHHRRRPRPRGRSRRLTVAVLTLGATRWPMTHGGTTSACTHRISAAGVGEAADRVRRCSPPDRRPVGARRTGAGGLVAGRRRHGVGLAGGGVPRIPHAAGRPEAAPGRRPPRLRLDAVRSGRRRREGLAGPGRRPPGRGGRGAGDRLAGRAAGPRSRSTSTTTRAGRWTLPDRALTVGTPGDQRPGGRRAGALGSRPRAPGRRRRSGMAQLDAAAAAATAGDVTDLMWMGKVCCWLISACEETHDLGRASDWCARVEEICVRRGLAPLLSVCRIQYASVLLASGRPDRRGVGARRGAVRTGAPRRLSRLDAVAQLGELRRRQGRPGGRRGAARPGWIPSGGDDQPRPAPAGPLATPAGAWSTIAEVLAVDGRRPPPRPRGRPGGRRGRGDRFGTHPGGGVGGRGAPPHRADGRHRSDLGARGRRPRAGWRTAGTPWSSGRTPYAGSVRPA